MSAADYWLALAASYCQTGQLPEATAHEDRYGGADSGVPRTGPISGQVPGVHAFEDDRDLHSAEREVEADVPELPAAGRGIELCELGG